MLALLNRVISTNQMFVLDVPVRDVCVRLCLCIHGLIIHPGLPAEICRRCRKKSGGFINKIIHKYLKIISYLLINVLLPQLYSDIWLELDIIELLRPRSAQWQTSREGGLGDGRRA